MGQRLETDSSVRIDVMRDMILARCFEMKCSCRSMWTAFAVLVMANILWLQGAVESQCSLRKVLNCLLVMVR